MTTAISELAADYDKTINTLSPRSAAVLARATLEAMFHLLGALHSKELAAGIIYGSTKEDLRHCRLMKEADPAPIALADKVIEDLKREVNLIETHFKDIKPITSTYQIAEKVDCEKHYRSHYFTLSQHIHANYATVPTIPNQPPSPIPSTVMLLACCQSADVIAEHYKHPNAEKIQSRSRSLWKERKQ